MTDNNEPRLETAVEIEEENKEEENKENGLNSPYEGEDAKSGQTNIDALNEIHNEFKSVLNRTKKYRKLALQFWSFVTWIMFNWSSIYNYYNNTWRLIINIFTAIISLTLLYSAYRVQIDDIDNFINDKYRKSNIYQGVKEQRFSIYGFVFKYLEEYTDNKGTAGSELLKTAIINYLKENNDLTDIENNTFIKRVKFVKYNAKFLSGQGTPFNTKNTCSLTFIQRIKTFILLWSYKDSNYMVKFCGKPMYAIKH